ncbi:MAG: hypothetical protein ACOCWJ_01765, partial [Verrucomicrobiota bacterium]
EMKGSRTNNIRQIQENIKRYTAARKSESSQDKNSVQIESLHIQNGKIRIGATLLGGHGVTIPMPKTTISDIDTAKDKDDKQVAALPVILGRILRTILGTAGNLVSDAGQETATPASPASNIAAKGERPGIQLGRPASALQN